MRLLIKIKLLYFLLFFHHSYALTPYSTQELDELEKQFIQQINQAESVERHPLANQYINQLGKKLASSAKMSIPSFFIVKSNEINAFAGPGGYIGINTQLILSTETESELAGVMAHELAHVRLHHLYELMEHGKQMRIPMLASLLASAALGIINPTLASGALMASITGLAQDNINFIRANEKQADSIGIDMLIRAGFNSNGMSGFFKKMQLNSRYYYTANVPAILRTHPLDDDRIAEAENRSSHLSNTRPDTLDYHLFKELIRTTFNQNSKQLLDYYKKGCHKNKLACQYGYVLALLNLNHFHEAEVNISFLIAEDKNNIFYQIAMAQAELGQKKFPSALQRLENLQANSPENYATLMAYAQGLLSAGHAQKAVKILLKGSRQFKKDLPLCEALSRAQAQAALKAEAYFTQSQCQLLQGRPRDAIRKLKLAKKLSKKNLYLLARANAMIEEIHFLMEKN